jgi:hypothetical protein
MFWVMLSSADAFEWGCDLTLTAETMTCDLILQKKTMTCDLMLAPQTMTCELAGRASFPPEKENGSEALEKARVYRHFSTQSVKIGIKVLCFTGKKVL